MAADADAVAVAVVVVVVVVAAVFAALLTQWHQGATNMEQRAKIAK